MIGFGSGRFFIRLESSSKLWYSKMDGMGNLRFIKFITSSSMIPLWVSLHLKLDLCQKTSWLLRYFPWTEPLSLVSPRWSVWKVWWNSGWTMDFVTVKKSKHHVWQISCRNMACETTLSGCWVSVDMSAFAAYIWFSFIRKCCRQFFYIWFILKLLFICMKNTQINMYIIWKLLKLYKPIFLL